MTATATPRSTDWDGFVVVVATATDQASDFAALLCTTIAGTSGGVLVTMAQPVAWPGGPVVAVALRRDDDGAVGPAIWLGPLSRPVERAALCRWLTSGPADEPLPAVLHRRVLRPAAKQWMHTTN